MTGRRVEKSCAISLMAVLLYTYLSQCQEQKMPNDQKYHISHNVYSLLSYIPLKFT